jgi:predicted ATPase
MISDVEKLIEKIGMFRPGKPLDKYISEVVFSNFKNIEPRTRITFDYPLTVLVGANGSGKSSILHALWGMPLRHSTSRFWFPTAIDPISEGGEHGIIRYFYSHWISGLKRSVQTKKVRGKKRLGYWEPARPSTADGMDSMPDYDVKHAPYRSKDRWNPVDRKVVYMNFKCESSAFDRYFYFVPKVTTLEERQEHVQKGAQRLRTVVRANRQSYKLGGKQAVFEHRDLSEEELCWISYILGHDYVSARYIFHRFYGNFEAPSVIFIRKNLTYSEAFAGSGELAVVRVVMELIAAEKYSLVLLDEPETSLHPKAQERLIAFLLQQILTKHLQVVISTHSPTIVKMLPIKAVKVLEENTSGRMRIVENTHPQVAFNRLGHIPDKMLLITVEDQLLCTLVKIAMKLLDKGEAEAISLHVPPSGADSILKYNVPTWLGDKSNVYVLLDGDKKPKKELPNPDALSEAEQKQLVKDIRETLGITPMECSEGNPEPAASYVRWVRDRLRFLDAICPEFVVLAEMIGEEKARKRAKTNEEAKAALVAELEANELDTNAEAINHFAQFRLVSVKDKNKYILGLRDILREFLAHHASQA